MLYGMAEITWTSPPESLRKPIVVAAFRGWNDAASAASAAQSYVAGKLDATLAGSIDPEDFYDFQSTRPLVDMTRPGEHTLSWPEIEIHIAHGTDRDVIFVSGAEPSMRWRTLCNMLLDAAIDAGATTFVTLGAFLADTPHTRPPRLTGMSSDPELVARMHFREPAYRGPSGIVGVLNQMSVERGLTGVSLWAPASHYAAGITNTKAALALVQALEATTQISVDLTELHAASAAYELQVSRAVEADPRLAELVRQLENASDDDLAFDPGGLPSGDELALELEQFLRDRESDSGTP
jgi:proteasome assembly chaperone (PAC2) family protein